MYKRGDHFMNHSISKRCLPALVLLSFFCSSLVSADDYLWLEVVEGEEQLAWAEEQNARSLPRIMSHPLYESLYQDSLEILNSRDRIPAVSRRGEYLYNLWRDADHVRGLYRRTTLDEYRKDEPSWETVLDLDELAEREDMNWTWGGINCLYPDYELCLINLSIAGSDAVVVREFNTVSKQFRDDGFVLPEAKSRLTWVDENTLIVGTEFNGNSLTDSGYPAQLKLWRRGTSVDDAELLYSAPTESVSMSSYTLRDGENNYIVLNESVTFYTWDRHVFMNGELHQIHIPADATVAGLFQDQLFVELKSDWQEFRQGAVVYAPMPDVLAGDAEFRVFVEPDERSAIRGVHMTADAVLVNWLDNVRARLVHYTPGSDGQWQERVVALDPNGTIGVQNTSHQHKDFFVSYTSFLDPTTLYHVADGSLEPQQIKQLPHQFDAERFETRQYMATSADGTQVPYFVVIAKDAELNGQNPTMMFGYGGFEISYTPNYSPVVGRNWLERGGVYVLTNIRGGGEFGPKWHQAALLENRHKAYEDFEAIAEDLIARGITSPQRLGIRGGSNGGLLTGAAVTRRPDLFGAVISQVPLLDMQRYNQLLAGASWMGEYGNPDDEAMWAYIRTYSPYHNVREDVSYPTIFFTTSTRDDRVHPAHARKMVAKMMDMGHDVLYYENTEGGHSGAANNEQRAQLDALLYAYLWKQLGE